MTTSAAARAVWAMQQRRGAWPPVATMLDVELIEAQRTVAEAQRRVSTIADEIAHRSRRPGRAGLVASRVQRSPEGSSRN